jgi:hypothetical protein
MKHLLIIFFGLVTLTTYSQEEPPTGEIEDAQIIIEKHKPLMLPKASRVYQKSQVRPVSQDTVSLSYNLARPQISLGTAPFQPVIKSYTGVDESTSGKNYVKAGFGNYLSPLIQGAVSFSPNEQASIGTYLFHESFASGPVRDDESAYANTVVGLSGRVNRDEMAINPLIQFENESFFYYGRPDSYISEIMSRVGINHFLMTVPVSLVSNEQWSFRFKPSFQYLTMGSDGSQFNQDTGVGLDGVGNYEVNEEFTAFARLGLTNWKYSSGLEANRTIFDVNPGVVYANDQLTLKAAALMSIGKDDSTDGVFVYPDVEIDYKLSDQIGLFVNAKGGLYANDLNELRLANRYLDDSLTLLNRNEKIRIEAGLTYAIRSDLTIEPFVEYSNASNRALFYHAASDSSRFGVVYDSEGIGTTNFGVTVRWLNNRSSLIAKMIISSYQTSALEEPWYLPTTQLKVKYDQSVAKNVQVNVGLNVLQGIKAPAPIDGSVIEMPTILDLSLGADYQVNESLSLFGELNNLVGGNYERYYNYPVRGIAAKAGVLFRF